MWVTSLQGLTVLIDDNHVMRSLGKLHHIVAQTNHEARQSGHIGSMLSMADMLPVI